MRTLLEVRREGIEALIQKLGPQNTIRFLEALGDDPNRSIVEDGTIVEKFKVPAANKS